MTKRAVLNASLLIAVLATAACGSGDDSSPSGTTPVPGGAGAAPAPGATPPAGGTPAPGSGSATVPTLASIPAGEATGGTASNTPSGYVDLVLAGRWQPAAQISNCISIPANSFCGPSGISFAFGQGYTASGLNATRIGEGAFYNGESCQAPNLVASARYAQDIAFQAADALISDSANPGLQIAVRRGVLSNLRAAFAQGTETGVTTLFAGCPSLNPQPGTDNTGTPETCTDTLQLRIEIGPSSPLLLPDDNSNCQPGTVAPPAVFKDSWDLNATNDGWAKLP